MSNNSNLVPAGAGGFRLDATQDECNAFFFLDDGGFRELSMKLGIEPHGDITVSDLCNQIVKVIISPDESSYAVATKISDDYDFSDLHQMVRAIKAIPSVHSAFNKGVQMLEQAFAADGVEKAYDEAMLATAQMMREAMLERDEYWRMQEEARENDHSISFDHVFARKYGDHDIES